MKSVIAIFFLFFLLAACRAPAPLPLRDPPQPPRQNNPPAEEEPAPRTAETEAAGETSSGSSNTTEEAPADSCPTGNFVAVQPDRQNDGYPAPVLNVFCTETDLVVETNNIPDFPFEPETPNPLTAQNFRFEIPLAPREAAQPQDVPLGGPIGVTVNGLVIFGPTEAPQDGYRDPFLDQILDYCNGHTAPGGVYHFHASPNCLFARLDGDVGLILGYAFDGYPILAPYLCAGSSPGTFPGETACSSMVELKSSWVDSNPEFDNAWERHSYQAGAGDLDRCNGLAFNDGRYAYFATIAFPYYLGCYRGEVAEANLIGAQGTP